VRCLAVLLLAFPAAAAPLPSSAPPLQLRLEGLFGQPTLINNVETFAWVPAIVARGGDWFRDQGINGAHGLKVMALSGDFFASRHAGAHGVEGTPDEPEGLPSDDLFRLAAIPGERGTKLGSRDEVICALKVMAVDGAFVDACFEPGGEFSHFRFTATAAATKVERRVRDRFLTLATVNGDHFVAPGRPDTAHDHKNPRHFWHHRYPWFWQSLQRKVATDTASALREFLRPARILPDGSLDDRVHTAVQARTRGFPPITLGDLLARVFHDWDNSHGLTLQGGGVLFGDGLLEEGVGKELAVAAVRLGIDDVEVAYRLGVSGSRLRGEAFYRVVRSATGAPDDAFRPETRIPTPSADNPPQNWRAKDAEALWSSPVVGTTGTTVGMAVEETLRLGAEVSRRLDCLGPGVFEVPGLLGIPAVRRWAARKACQAYHLGFIQGLAQDPRAAVLAIVNNEAGSFDGSGHQPSEQRVATLPTHHHNRPHRS